jgi:hypothetical protein
MLMTVAEARAPLANNEGNPKCAVETPGGRTLPPMVQMRPTNHFCRRSGGSPIGPRSTIGGFNHVR